VTGFRHVNDLSGWQRLRGSRSSSSSSTSRFDDIIVECLRTAGAVVVTTNEV
jgi:hypothetical protein